MCYNGSSTIEGALSEWQQAVIYTYAYNGFDVASTALELECSEADIQSTVAEVQRIGASADLSALGVS